MAMADICHILEFATVNWHPRRSIEDKKCFTFRLIWDLSLDISHCYSILRWRAFAHKHRAAQSSL